MNKLLSIDPGVLKRLRNLSKKEKIDCLLALSNLSEAFGHPHLKRYARDDRLNQRRKRVVRGSSRSLDSPDRRRIRRVEPSSERVGQQLLGHGRQKVVGMSQQYLPQFQKK